MESILVVPPSVIMRKMTDGTQSKRITVGESGRRIVLEIGKTYVFYEKTTPDGYDKAKKSNYNSNKRYAKEIILSDN